MKKILLSILTITAFGFGVNAQCTPVFSISENFSTTVNDPPNVCWTEVEPLAMAYNTGAMRIFGAVNGDPWGIVILPEVSNANGILTFRARKDPSFLALPGDGMEIGVYGPSGYNSLFTFTYEDNYANYSFDFSSYAGTGKRIYFMRTEADRKGVEIDDINYTSGCVSANATAIAQNITISLDGAGSLTLLPSQVDNGSQSDCGNHTLSLNTNTFNCGDIGVNPVVLTITDSQGNTSSSNANVTITDGVAPVADAVSLADLTAQCEITSLTAPTATDNCAGTITATHNGTLPFATNQTITWTYDDGNGNVSSQTQTVVVNDDTAPVADVVSLTDLTAQCEVTSLTAPTATDNCAGTITATHNGTLPFATNQTITWTYDDGNGNSSLQTQIVTISGIDVSTTLNGNTLIATQTGATYQWVDCDNGNAAINGAENQDFSPASSGNYAVEVTIDNCTETSGCTSMTVTGLNEAYKSSVSVYPVPTSGILNIKSNSIIDEASIYAVDGSLVRTLSQNPQSIDVSELVNGMYLLVARTEAGVSQIRFVKD